MVVSTDADDSRDRRLAARQHQREHSHILGPDDSRLTEAEQLALVLRRSARSPDPAPDDAASGDAHDSDNDAAAPPVDREPDPDNPDAASGSATSLSGVVNAAAAPADYDESLALAQALSLPMISSDSVTPADDASTLPTSAEPTPNEQPGDAASDAAQDSDGDAADPSANPMPDFDDPDAAPTATRP